LIVSRDTRSSASIKTARQSINACQRQSTSASSFLPRHSQPDCRASLIQIVAPHAPLGQVTLFDPTDTLYADDGIEADLTEEALINAVGEGGAAVVLPLWQSNLLAVRAIRYLSWQVARPDSVAYISGLAFGGTTP
jgi:hypothetical protein